MKECDRMPGKDPTNYSLITYFWVIALSFWGGITNNIQKLREGKIARFSLAELIGDIFISGFIGVLTFWLCEASGFNQLLTAFLVGISSHMGARGLIFLEEIAFKKFGVDRKDSNDG